MRQILSGYSNKRKTIMIPTIAVSEPAAAIEPGVGSVVSVMAHKISVRSTQTKPRSFDAVIMLSVCCNDFEVSSWPQPGPGPVNERWPELGFGAEWS